MSIVCGTEVTNNHLWSYAVIYTSAHGLTNCATKLTLYTHPHILTQFKNRAQWRLTLRSSYAEAHYHLRLAVNGFLSWAPCSIQATGYCSPSQREKAVPLVFLTGWPWATASVSSALLELLSSMKT